MEKAMELIEQLANQLGVAVEYLWATLIKQQYAEGITSLVWVVFGIVMMIIIAIYAPKLTKKADEKYKNLVIDRKTNSTGFSGTTWLSSIEEDNWDNYRKAIPICAFIIFIIMFFMTACNVEMGVQKLINPDYFALKEILDVISSAQ